MKVVCTFCGNSEDDAMMMFKRSEQISICDECISMCLESITGKHAHTGFKKHKDVLEKILDRAGIQADLSNIDNYPDLED